MKLPPGPYRLILADPPWATLTWSGITRTPTTKRGEDHYGTMSAVDLAAMPVGQIAARDAVLAMWAIGSHLKQALALGEAWGFTYVTDGFYWAKERLIDAGQLDMFTGDLPEPVIGMGKYTRKQIEPCLFFKRGRGCKVLRHDVRQLIIAPRREHSRKPEEQYERLDALFGPLAASDGTPARLELFARQRRPG